MTNPKRTNTRMKTRITRLAAASAVAAGLALGASAPAQAQSTVTAGFCSGSTLISYTLKNGAQWEMCWGTDNLKGLVLTKVAFKGPRDTAPKLVINQIATVQMNVPYSTGNLEYDDVLQYGFGGQYLQSLAASECPKGELREATVSWETNVGIFNQRTIPALCIREVDSGTAYRSQWRTGGQLLTKQGTDLVVHATAAIGNYEYEMRYAFHDDGQIDASLGATGDATTFTNAGYEQGWPVGQGNTDAFLSNHYHSGVWRVHFALDNQSQQRVEQWDAGPTGQRGTQSAIYKSTKTDITNEATLKNANRRWFRVLAPNSRNEDDHPRSYEFVHQKTDPYDSYPHLKYDLSFTQYRACEQFPMRNRSAVDGCGGQTLMDYVSDAQTLTNPVAWVNVGFHHVVRDEDQSPMPIHWQGFSIVPRDWHAQNSQIPALRAGVNGRSLPVTPTATTPTTTTPTTTTPTPATTTTPTTTTPSSGGTSAVETGSPSGGETSGTDTPAAPDAPPAPPETPAAAGTPPAAVGASAPASASKLASKSLLRLSSTKVSSKKRARIAVRVTAPGAVPAGKVTITINGRTLRVVTLKKGTVTLTLPRLKPGTYKIAAGYTGSAAVSGSTSASRTITVTK